MNGTSKLVNIQNADGSNEQYTILSSFKLSDINKNFVIYHKNEIANGVQKIYVSEVDDKELGLLVFKNIDDEGLWTRVKEMLKVIANFQDGVTIEDSYLEGYNILDTSKIVKQGSKEIGVRDVNPLIKVLPQKEAASAVNTVSSQEPVASQETSASNEYVENPYSAPNVTPSSENQTPVVSAPVEETPVAPQVANQVQPASLEAIPNVGQANQVVEPARQQAPEVVSTPVDVNAQAVNAPIQPTVQPTAPMQSTLGVVNPVQTVQPVQAQAQIFNPTVAYAQPVEQPSVPTIEPVMPTQLPINNNNIMQTQNSSVDVSKEIEWAINDYFDMMKAQLIAKLQEIINKKDAELNEVAAYANNALNTVNNQVANVLYNPQSETTAYVNNQAEVPASQPINPNVTMAPNQMVR